ncbi:hypothetical protein ACFXTO_025182 [Malus domestica]
MVMPNLAKGSKLQQIIFQIFLMIAIDKLLLAEAHKLFSCEIVCTFQRSCSTETPTRSVQTLIFNGGDSFMLSPIKILRQILCRENQSLGCVDGQLQPSKTELTFLESRRMSYRRTESRRAEPMGRVAGGARHGGG